MPRGLLRIAVTSIAEEFLSGPLIASFAAANPAVTLDIVVTDEEFDIVAAGYDAGVRLGEVIEKDMIAVSDHLVTSKGKTSDEVIYVSNAHYDMICEEKEDFEEFINANVKGLQFMNNFIHLGYAVPYDKNDRHIQP